MRVFFFSINIYFSFIKNIRDYKVLWNFRYYVNIVLKIDFLRKIM